MTKKVQPLSRTNQKAWSRANQQAEKASAILREEMKTKKRIVK